MWLRRWLRRRTTTEPTSAPPRGPSEVEQAQAQADRAMQESTGRRVETRSAYLRLKREVEKNSFAAAWLATIQED